MEKIIEWFKKNELCLTLLDEPKAKKAGLIKNMLVLLSNEQCNKCRAEDTDRLFSKEEVVKLINFVSENNNMIVTPYAVFEYNDKTYRVKAQIIENFDDFINKLDSSLGKVFIYNIINSGNEVCVRYAEEGEE